MRREDGFTLVELMVAATLMLVVMSATLLAVEKFQRNSNANQALNDSQEAARGAVDRMARELRNSAAPAKGSNSGIGRALANDFVFQSVDDTGASGGTNVRHSQWVRYCLDSVNAANENLWRQTYTWTGSSTPSVPFDATACPDAAVGTRQLLASHLVNAQAPATSVFDYDPPLPGSPTPEDYQRVDHVSMTALVNSDPKRQVKATTLTSGVYLRNQAVPPVAAFADPIVSGSGQVYLNGSDSTDPLGNLISYLWCDTTGGGSCTQANAIGSGVTMQYDSPSGTRSITLVVTNAVGQTDSVTKQVIVP